MFTSLKKEHDLSEENTLECEVCYQKESKLVHAQFSSGGTKHCCKECFEGESKDDVTRCFHAKPGVSLFKHKPHFSVF